MAFNWNGYQPAIIRYDIQGLIPGREVCTGWVYPIYNVDQRDWPYRKSCRDARFHFIHEEWGRNWPFPYVGEYRAFVEQGDTRIERQFQILDGIPR